MFTNRPFFNAIGGSVLRAFSARLRVYGIARFGCAFWAAMLLSTADLDAVEVSANRLLVGNTYTDSISEFDLTSGQYVRMLVPTGRGGLEEPAGMAIGPDGALYVANAWKGNILKFDLGTGDFLGVFASGFDLPVSLSYANGDFYVASRGDKVIFRLNGNTGAVTGQTPLLSYSVPWDAELSADGERILMSNYARDNILAFDAKTFAYEGVFSNCPGVSVSGHIEIGPDGNVYQVGGDSKVHCYDGQTGADLGAIPVPGIEESAGLAFGPDGDLFVSDHRHPGIYQLDGQTWDLVRVIDSAGAHTSGSWCILAVPEPSTFALLSAGAIGLIGYMWLRKRRA